MKVIGFIFGGLAGFVISTLIGQSIVLGGGGALIGAVIGSQLGKWLGKKAVTSEVAALSGESRSTGKAIFWWFVLLIIAAAALVLYGLKYR